MCGGGFVVVVFLVFLLQRFDCLSSWREEFSTGLSPSASRTPKTFSGRGWGWGTEGGGPSAPSSTCTINSSDLEPEPGAARPAPPGRGGGRGLCLCPLAAPGRRQPRAPPRRAPQRVGLRGQHGGAPQDRAPGPQGGRALTVAPGTQRGLRAAGAAAPTHPPSPPRGCAAREPSSPSQLQPRSFGGESRQAFALPSPCPLPGMGWGGGGQGNFAGPAAPSPPPLVFLRRGWARSLAPPSVLVPAPRGLSQMGGGGGVSLVLGGGCREGGRHGGAEGSSEQAWSSILESQEERGCPLPGRQGDPCGHPPPRARPRTSGARGKGVGQRRGREARSDSNPHARTWAVSLARPLRSFCLELTAPAAAAARPRAAGPPVPRRFLLSSPRSRGAQERPLRSPHAVDVKPGLDRSASANPASSPQNFRPSHSLPRGGGRQREAEMKDTLWLFSPSNLRGVCTKLGAQGGVLGWKVQKSVVPAKTRG